MTHNNHKVKATTAPNGLLDTDKLIQAGLIPADAKHRIDRLTGNNRSVTSVTGNKSTYTDSDIYNDHHGVSANNEDHAIDTEENTPWFLQIFLGASGFFAGIAIIAFIGLIMSSALDETSVLVTVGLILLVISFGLFRIMQNSANTFVGSLAFAFSVAGQLFIAVAMFNRDISQTTSVLMLMLFQIIMAVVIANLAHRMLNFMVALGCMVWFLSYFDASEFTAGFLALLLCIFNLQRYEWLDLLNINSEKLRTLSLQISRAMTYASSLMLLGISVYVITAEYRHDSIEYGYYHYPLAQLILILISSYAAYLILRRYGKSLHSQVGIVTVVAIAVLGTLSVFVSGLLASSLVIVIAMANRQRILMILGIIALVSYVFWYYYQLDTSLIVKSISMLVVGMALLIARWLLMRMKPAHNTDVTDATSTTDTSNVNKTATYEGTKS